MVPRRGLTLSTASAHSRSFLHLHSRHPSPSFPPLASPPFLFSPLTSLPLHPLAIPFVLFYNAFPYNLDMHCHHPHCHVIGQPLRPKRQASWPSAYIGTRKSARAGTPLSIRRLDRSLNGRPGPSRQRQTPTARQHRLQNQHGPCQSLPVAGSP